MKSENLNLKLVSPALESKGTKCIFGYFERNPVIEIGTKLPNLITLDELYSFIDQVTQPKEIDIPCEEVERNIELLKAWNECRPVFGKDERKKG